MTGEDELKSHRMLLNVLRALGGQKFVTDWARKNPTDFMNLYVHARQIEISSCMRNRVADDSDPDPEQDKLLSHGTDHLGARAFDRKKAAEYLSISSRLLDDLLSAGTITRIKIGRKTLIRKIDLDSYLCRLAHEATS